MFVKKRNRSDNFVCINRVPDFFGMCYWTVFFVAEEMSFGSAIAGKLCFLRIFVYEGITCADNYFSGSLVCRNKS